MFYCYVLAILWIFLFVLSVGGVTVGMLGILKLINNGIGSVNGLINGVLMIVLVGVGLWGIELCRELLFREKN